MTRNIANWSQGVVISDNLVELANFSVIIRAMFIRQMLVWPVCTETAVLTLIVDDYIIIKLQITSTCLLCRVDGLQQLGKMSHKGNEEDQADEDISLCMHNVSRSIIFQVSL